MREHALPVDAESIIGAIKDAATTAGVETYLVGGFVRDRLLGRAAPEGSRED